MPENREIVDIDPTEALHSLHVCWTLAHKGQWGLVRQKEIVQVSYNENPLSKEQSQNQDKHLGENLGGRGQAKRKGDKIGNADRQLQNPDIADEVKNGNV